jgi:hypothetical protein
MQLAVTVFGEKGLRAKATILPDANGTAKGVPFHKPCGPWYFRNP